MSKKDNHQSFLLIAFSVLISVAQAEDNPIEKKSLTSREYPHLVAAQIDFDKIYSKILAHKEPWWSQYQLVMAEGDSVNEYPNLWDDEKLMQSDWEEYKSKADQGQRRLASLTLAYLYSHDAEVGLKLRNHVLGWCDLQKLALIDQYFINWNQTHPIASLAIIIALTYDFHYHDPLFTANDKAQILNWLNATVSFILPRHQSTWFWSNIKAWDNAALILAGLLLEDDYLVNYVIDSPSNLIDTKDLIDIMIRPDGQVCDYWQGCYELWYSLLIMNAFLIVNSAAVENGYANLLSTEEKFVKSFEYYAPLFQTNDINSLPPGYSLSDPPSPYYLYFSGIYEIAYKYLPTNDIIKNTLLDPDFNIDTGRFCRRYMGGISSCYFCSRWVKFPLLVWGQEINYSKLQAKILLQGFYSESPFMHSNLVNAQLLPHLSPYDDAPKFVSSWPDSVVDWVTVTLYRADGSVAGVESALLRQDGWIMDIDGTLGISVEIEPGEHYLSIGHRNHLSVMTQIRQYLSPTDEGVWDLTQYPDQFVNATAMIQVENGLWAARCGDINRDGLVNTRDYVQWYSAHLTSQAGYWAADLNADGQVTFADYDLWLANARDGACAITNFE